MRFPPFCFLLTLLFATGILAEETPRPRATLTFFLRGVECPACVYAVNDSIRQVDGVEEIADGQDNDFYATVTFDASKASAHRIAQAVTEAYPLHGAPYQAALRIRFPDYGKDGNDGKIKAFLGRWKDLIKVEVTDRIKGEITLHFLPLPEDETKGTSGWRHEDFLETLRHPTPEGLGLEVEWVDLR